MRIALVVEQFHDHGPFSQFIDLDRLDKSNPIDAEILREMKRNKEWEIGVWCNGNEDDDLDISEKAIIEDPAMPITIERVIFLTICFD